ncbi:motility associated factor glycosyltransferase family protein [Deferribacterales bacterium RsTz2092]|nr:hypothetical protein AGMMS49941_04830 [Deferribacterales bacterium]
MYLEKNLNALAKRYPEYVEPIRNARETGRYVISKTSANNYNVFDKKVGAYFYNNVDALMSVDKEIDALNIRLPQVCIFIGFGLGYHLIGAAAKFQTRSMAFVVFEADPEILKLAFTLGDYSNFIPQRSIAFCLCGMQPQAYYPLVYGAFTVNGRVVQFMKTINIITCATSYSSNRTYYSQCMDVLRQASSSAVLLYGNDPDDAILGIRNTFYNVEEIINNPGIKDVKDVFKNKVGVVVSSGPSLDKNIELLHTIQDRAVMIAPDASLRIMREHNLKPHMVTSLERVVITAQLFGELPDEAFEDIYFAACPVIQPAVYEAYHGKKVVVYRKFATFQWLGVDKGILEIGQSAGNMAFKILEYMGCNPIILIGQDLAYEGERTHAGGATFGEVEAGYKDSIMVEGNYVPQIRTSRVWNMFRQFYEKDVASFKGTVVNATEGGAKIHGTVVMTFQEAIDKYINKDKALNVQPVLEKRLKVPFPAQVKKDRASIAKKTKEALKYTDYLLETTSKGGDEAKAWIDKINGIKATNAENVEMAKSEILKLYDEVSANLSKIGRFLDEQQFYLIYMHYVQAYVIKMQNDINAILALAPSAEAVEMLVNAYGALYTNLHSLIVVMQKEFLQLDNRLNNV